MNDYKKLVDIKLDEIEPVEVSELEKKRVKQYVLGTKKKTKVYKYMAMAAMITFGATVATSFAVPSLASQIPFFNNIIQYFLDENSYNSNFAEVAMDISQTQSSNGVSVMIENAVYDGSSITVTYAIEIQSFETNNLSTVIHYKQYVEKHILEKGPHVTAQIINVTDDLGNKYAVDSNGGVSRDNEQSYEWSSTIKSINPNAKSITLEPVIYFSLGSGKGLEKKKMEPIRIDLK